ncbi:MAG TPA: hypothetical protein VEF34_21210 [Syntrophobacteraceae bacterium]|nr:hypothetical protein [Syntrophobacteraceae bacterium]
MPLTMEALQHAHRAWTEHTLASAEHVRESKWTQGIAVGGREFVDTIKSKLGVSAKGSRLSGTDAEARLRYPKAAS